MLSYFLNRDFYKNTPISGRNYKNALCAHKLCVKYFLCNSIISSSSIIIILTFSDSLSLDLLEFLLIFCFTLWLRRKAQKTWLFRIWRGHFRNIGLKWGHFCKIPFKFRYYWGLYNVAWNRSQWKGLFWNTWHNFECR